MNHIQRNTLRSHLELDGLLHLEVPVGLTNVVPLVSHAG